MTGVQTCALPISGGGRPDGSLRADGGLLRPERTAGRPPVRHGLAAAAERPFPEYHLAQPQPPPGLGAYWSQTYDVIAQEFPMYLLTVDGLEEGMKKLLAR